MDVEEVSENPEDKRKSRSPSNKLSENYIDFFEEELESNSNLKNNAMVKLFKDKFGIEVSENTIEEHSKNMKIIILDLKYDKKYLERDARKIRLV